MPTYNVDVKAFIAVTVNAENERIARAVADEFVEGLSPTNEYIAGYNSSLIGCRVADETDCFSVDGLSVVERMEDAEEKQTFSVIVTRDTTESAVVKVYAASEEEAEAAALERVSELRVDDWVRDYTPNASKEVTITGVNVR